MRVALHGQDVSALRDYCAARGWQVVGEYEDFDLLLADARARRFEGVLILSLRHLDRSLDYLLATFEKLDALGISLISLCGNVTLSTLRGRVIAALRGSFADFQRRIFVDQAGWFQ